jgi:hypothetical protein
MATFHIQAVTVNKPAAERGIDLEMESLSRMGSTRGATEKFWELIDKQYRR